MVVIIIIIIIILKILETVITKNNKYNNFEKIELLDIICGVPQESILGPLNFLNQSYLLMKPNCFVTIKK